MASRDLRPIVELGVAEAYDLLVERFGQLDLPPLEAIENEDWGRDVLLSRFLALDPETLADAGVTLEDAKECESSGQLRPHSLPIFEEPGTDPSRPA